MNIEHYIEMEMGRSIVEVGYYFNSDGSCDLTSVCVSGIDILDAVKDIAGLGPGFEDVYRAVTVKIKEALNAS